MFYLKYRPQKISQLDLTEIRERLARVLASTCIPHAFLFAGPRGTGKTSAARIVAKAVNCQRRVAAKERSTSKVKYEPCNKCSICQSITNGTALDLMEIDAASHRGIDDIRNLREKISTAPSRAQYKVYIIDEAHMLTTPAFNALLKTLEEPPKHALFILCTTEPEKLPETIISRCLRFNFRKGRLEEVIRSLKRVVKGEKLSLEEGVLEEIARSVDGSFRDGQKILEQLTLEDKKITLKMAEEEIGKSRRFQPETLLELLVQKDSQAALKEINRVTEGGMDLKIYTQQLLEKLRERLLNSVQENLSDELEKEEIVHLIRLFTRAGQEFKEAIIPQLPLELAIIEWCLTD